MDTTVTNVRAIASHLRSLPDSTIELYIQDAKTEMETLAFKPVFKEKIMRYLAAHYATIDYPKVKSESVDGLGSQTYKDTIVGKEELASTEYGQEVLRLLKKSRPGFVVIS